MRVPQGVVKTVVAGGLLLESMMVSWQVPENVSPATRYDVYQRSEKDWGYDYKKIGDVMAPQNTFVATGLEKGVLYCFYAVAVDTSGGKEKQGRRGNRSCYELQ